MKGFWLCAICSAALSMLPNSAMRLQAADARVHTQEKFTFTAHAPMERVAPLFGANQERVWSPGWDPRFIYPLPAADAKGMVFTVEHGQLNAIWVNTEFDLKNGRVQYVYVIPDALVTVITLRLKAEGADTRVEVEYDRTALNPEADAHVQHLAKQDRNAGPEWETQVNSYLRKRSDSVR